MDKWREANMNENRDWFTTRQTLPKHSCLGSPPKLLLQACSTAYQRQSPGNAADSKTL